MEVEEDRLGDLVTLPEIQKAVDLDRLAREYAPGDPLSDDFPIVKEYLTKKAVQESLDGAGVK